MFVKKDTKFAKKNRDTILPLKTALLINDLVAVILFAMAVSLAIILATYNPSDRCWFSTINSSIVYNKFGILGSYASDLFLSIFGFSSWWLVVGLFYLGYRKIIRNKIDVGDWYNILQVTCFLLLLLSSSIVEYFNFYFLHSGYLHYGYGGMLGRFLYTGLALQIGPFGAAAASMVMLVVCFSMSFSISLSYLAEKVGFVLEKLYMLIVKLISHKDDRLPDLELVSPSPQPKFTKQPNAYTEEPKSSSSDDISFNALFNESGAVAAEVEPFTDIHALDDLEEEIPVPVPVKQSNFFKRMVKAHKNDETEGLESFDNVKHKQASYSIVKETSHNSILPTTDLLHALKKQAEVVSDETIEYISVSIENKLSEFGVDAKVINAESGPVITRYEILPSRGVRGDKIVSLGKEIARGLALTNVRIVETVPGKNSMGIEVPNFKRQIIYLKEIFESPVYQNSMSKLTLALGKDIAGEVVVADLAKMPHLLVAGTTGAGKSVAINVMIMSLLFQATPDEVKFIMIDPKMVELSFYQDIPHLLAPVVTDMNQAANALKWTVGEMERRYRIMAKVGCKNIQSLNQKISEVESNGEFIPNPLSQDKNEPLTKYPYIVVIIDELADLMMVTGKKIEQYIARIAQKARAVGIHLIVATQRPSVDVITGLIKANIPARISFQVSSKIDSRTILDQMGAETLLGQGDMLFLKPGSGFLQRVHGAYVDDNELNQVVDFLKASGKPEYVDEILEGNIDGANLTGFDDDQSNEGAEKDSMFDEAVKFIYDSKRCSISGLQTRFGIGYNRAARIMAHLEQIGMVKRNERGGFELIKRQSVDE